MILINFTKRLMIRYESKVFHMLKLSVQDLKERGQAILLFKKP